MTAPPFGTLLLCAALLVLSGPAHAEATTSAHAGGLELQTSPAADSARVLQDVQRRMAGYIRQVRQDSNRFQRWNLPAERERVQEERGLVLVALDEAATDIPGDDWVAGHRIGMRVKAGRLGEAREIARDCEATPWWCRALEGFVLHVQGDSLAAHLSFDEAIEGMPDEERCAWQEELGEILVGALRRPYNRADCDELDELARRVWWLADPFHLLPWNDWRSEHFARLVGMRLHHESEELVGARCTPAHHMQVLLHGWPDWWWGYDHTWETPPPPSHQFLPPSSVALSPFDSNPWDWDLIEDPYLERVDLDYELIHDLDAQTAFFRRGDSILVGASADMERHIMRGVGSLTTGVVVSGGPGADRYVRSETGPPSHVRFQLLVPTGEYLVSVESIADSWGAARTRSGHRLSEPSPSGLALSDLLLVDWSDGAPAEGAAAEAVIPRMLGTSRIASNREVGIFWETYGTEDGSSLEVALRVRPTEEGFFRRLGRRLGVVGRDEAITLSWTDQADPVEGGMVVRSLRLDVSTLDPGRYVMEVRVGPAGGGEPVSVQRRFEVDWR